MISRRGPWRRVGGWVGAGVGIAGSGQQHVCRMPRWTLLWICHTIFFILHIPSSPHSVQLSHAGVEKQDAQQASELLSRTFSARHSPSACRSRWSQQRSASTLQKMPWDSSRAIQNTSAVNRILFLILSRFSMRDARRQWILALRWLTQVCTRCRPYLRYVRHGCRPGFYWVQVACDGLTEPSSLPSCPVYHLCIPII